jgi:DNA replicative helicase MCM subunit Mcm2 (Cdc46/Mcm family)
MFGVIVCPGCNRARGVDISTAATVCPSCGKKIDVRKAKVYFKTDSESELAEAVRRMSERLAVDVESSPPVRKKKKKLSFHEELGAQAKRVKGSEERLRFVTKSLTNELGKFGADDLALVVKNLGETDVEDLIEKMLSSGIIFEPEPGKYRSA